MVAKSFGYSTSFPFSVAVRKPTRATNSKSGIKYQPPPMEKSKHDMCIMIEEISLISF